MISINLKPKEWYEGYFQSIYENENDLNKRLEKEMINDNLIDNNLITSLPNSFNINYYINSNDLECNKDILKVVMEFFCLKFIVKNVYRKYQTIIERLILLENILEKGYLITQQLEFFISYVNELYGYFSKKDMDFFNVSLDYSYPIIIATEFIKESFDG